MTSHVLGLCLPGRWAAPGEEACSAELLISAKLETVQGRPRWRVWQQASLRVTMVCSRAPFWAAESRKRAGFLPLHLLVPWKAVLESRLIL